MKDPWTILGWLAVAYIVVAMVVVPVALWKINRERKRAMERIEAAWEERGRVIRAGDRFKL